VTITGTSALTAAGTARGGTVAALQPATAAAVLAVAEADWIAAGASRSTLAAVRLVITTLPDGELGGTVGHTVYVDPTADGFGWYVGGSQAFGADGHALAGCPAAGRMDLLSVLLHELGHVLGLEHGVSVTYGDVMLPDLAAGERRLLPVPPALAVSGPAVAFRFAQTAARRESAPLATARTVHRTTSSVTSRRAAQVGEATGSTGLHQGVAVAPLRSAPVGTWLAWWPLLLVGCAVALLVRRRRSA
jgi:hypothetical protein